MGNVWMDTRKGITLLKDCLLAPGLGANSISVRKANVYGGLQKLFIEEQMYLKENEVVLSASHNNGNFSIDSVSPNKE